MIVRHSDPEPIDFRSRPLVGAPARRGGLGALAILLFIAGLLLGLLFGLGLAALP